MSFGKIIKKLRDDRNWTLDYVANKLNVGKSTISNYERDYRKPDIDMLKKIANLFNVSVDFLLENIPDTNEKNINNLTDEEADKLADEIIEIYIKKGKIKRGEKLTLKQRKKILREIEAFIDMTNKLEGN